ncbi:uncharacterized protein [Cicer arietinum]|uniref:uncharacterized protein n=1 Tax=Cicer arietinum TaxID=3827 RepID=UPI003CC56DFA
MEGFVNGVSVLVLIDSGATHNFVIPTVVEALVLSVLQTIRLGDGHCILTLGKCEEVPLVLGSIAITVEAYVLGLTRADLILGVVWLETLGKVIMDWKEMSMLFNHGRRPVQLRGMSAKGRAATMQSVIRNDIEVDVFKEIEGLPPMRNTFHAIFLRHGAGPASVRPYRYPHYQKDEIEKQITHCSNKGFEIGVPSNSHEGGRYSQNCFSYPQRPLRILGNAFWIDQRSDYTLLRDECNIPAFLCAAPTSVYGEQTEMCFWAATCGIFGPCNFRASWKRVGVVLMQLKHPIAYFSKAFSANKLSKSAYDKELMALMLAIQHWRHYLLGRKFVVYSDQKSLRHLIQQQITTSNQQEWIAKLLGFDFEVIHKVGMENKVADAFI